MALNARARIDDLLPRCDFRADYKILISAPPSRVYECLLHLDFSELWLTRMLMTLRTGRIVPRQQGRELRQHLQGSGFVILDEVPDEELVIGVAGRFWRPDGGRCRDLQRADFSDFSRSGYAKAAWNFRLRAAPPEANGTFLSTETRIQCFGPAALWKFRIYWLLIGPFSGLIRKAILKQAKTRAESELV
jgi:hypothetical protein